MRMHVILAGTVFLIQISIITAYGDRRREVINAARCRVRCLRNSAQTSVDLPVLAKHKQSTSLPNCLQEPACTACLLPCSQPFVDVGLCKGVCEQDSPSCAHSCEFLEHIHSTRPGSCPQPNVEALSSECNSECSKDADCAHPDSKCCNIGCGQICMPPYDPYDGMAPIPGTPSVREKSKVGSIELRWDSVLNASAAGPVLYIVDARWNVGQRHSTALMTPWQQIAQTTGLTTTMRDVTPGHWYEFRVECVNLFGSRGPSLPSEAFRLSREPGVPGPPANLTEGDTLIKEGKVSVTIKWLPPRKSDLPITRYKVMWIKKHRMVSTLENNDEEQRHVLPGDQLGYELPDLDLDTTYFVQVQAICHYGDHRLKSEKSSMSITTYPLPRAAERVAANRAGNQGASITFQSIIHPTPAPVANVAIGEPFFHNGLVKANVSWRIPEITEEDPVTAKVMLFWSPEACIAADSSTDDGLSKLMSATTDQSSYTVYDLRFDCRYVMRVQSVSAQNVAGPVSHAYFSTPSCMDIKVFGDNLPDCPSNVLMVPNEPPHLQHKFIISSSNNITAVMSWETPHSDAPLAGYRVEWGLLNFDSKLDKTFTKVLHKDESRLSLINLKESSTYIVEVQALSGVGPGNVASIQFTTPVLTAGVRGPSYKQVTDTNSATSLFSTSKPSAIPMEVASKSDLSIQLYSSSWIPSSNWLPWRLAFVTVIFHRCHQFWFSIT